MYQILKLNKIAGSISDYFPEEQFTLSADCDNPDGVIVRSADMHAFVNLGALLAVARAGAGTNKHPLRRLRQIRHRRL